MREPRLHPQRLIYETSNAIETEPERAVARADDALAACERLPAGDKAQLWGQALGTKGRSLLHAGFAEEAERWLRDAVTHHAAHRKEDEPRSATYLATCLRRLGRLGEAFAAIEHALKRLEELPKFDTREMTKLYALLERGRIHVAVGRDIEAVADLERVRRTQGETTAYPGLGALRSLVGLLKRLGRLDEARAHLEACARVANAKQTTNVARIAAVAVGEELLSEGPMLPREQLQRIWQDVFGEAAHATVVRSWFY